MRGLQAAAGRVMRLRFGEFVLDPDARQLFRGSRELRLGPRSFDLLELLARSRPRALRKAEIQRHLWPDAAVGDGSLAFLVSELRALLGDDARRPRFIRTVPAFGYAFCGEVRQEVDAAHATASGVPRIVWEDRVVPLAGESKNGTFVGRRDARVSAPTSLPDGCPFRLGRVLLTYRSAAETASTATEPGP